MANDLATLRARLVTALRDPDNETWTTAELNDILGSAAAQLYPRVAIPLSLPIYPLDSEVEDYPLPTGILEASSIELAEVATDDHILTLGNGAWRIYGDPLIGEGVLQINRSYADLARYLVVHGYGTYNLVDPLPPDMYVPFILATARAEAWRAMVSDRARFANWMKLNQKENVSVNELSNMIALAEDEAERHYARMKTWRKPKPAK